MKNKVSLKEIEEIDGGIEKNYRYAEDVVDEFLSERCERTEGEVIGAKAIDLYNAFKDWHELNIRLTVPHASFVLVNIGKQYPREKINGINYYAGLKLKDAPPEDARVTMARVLMRQIDEADQQSSFWMVGCLLKICAVNPRMSMMRLMTVIEKEMPKAFQNYRKY